MELRASYIEEHAVDRDIALPAGGWAEGSPNDFCDAYQFVVTPKYDVINRLRFYTQAFTGYQLVSFSDAQGKRSVNPVPNNFDEIIEELVPAVDQWVRRYLTICRYIPKDIIATSPKILGEIGRNVGGSPVNKDSYSYQERLNCLFEAGIIGWLRQKVEISGSVNIIEIGGGYGGLAYHLKSVLPQANYLICDLPESLLFSSIYLAIAYPEFQHTIYDGTDKSILARNDCGFKFIPNFMFDDLMETKCKIDLAINTLSFTEMSERQVRYYAYKLKNMLGDTGVLFEQNNIYFSNELLCDPKPLICEYFSYRNTLKPKSAVLTRGVADIWANRPISSIISPSLKPFKGKIWSIRWMIYWAINWRTYIVPYIIYNILKKNILKKKRFGPLKEFVKSKPRLSSFLSRFE